METVISHTLNGNLCFQLHAFGNRASEIASQRNDTNTYATIEIYTIQMRILIKYLILHELSRVDTFDALILCVPFFSQLIQCLMFFGAETLDGLLTWMLVEKNVLFVDYMQMNNGYTGK